MLVAFIGNLEAISTNTDLTTLSPGRFTQIYPKILKALRFHAGGSNCNKEIRAPYVVEIMLQTEKNW